MNREAIYSALFDLVSAPAGLVSASRKLRHVEEVSPAEMPALYQLQGKELAGQKTGMPAVWTIDLDLYLYVPTQGAVCASTIFNPIVDDIAAKLDYVIPGVPQTLGGLVQWARIEGAIEIFEGNLGDRAIVIIPVRILAV